MPSCIRIWNTRPFFRAKTFTWWWIGMIRILRHRHPLGVAVDPLALLAIDDGQRAFDDLVHLRIGVARGIEHRATALFGIRGRDELRQVAARLAGVARPAGQADREFRL